MNSTVRSSSCLMTRRPFKVLVSLVTGVAFLFNTLSYDLAWAADTSSKLADSGFVKASGPGKFKALDVEKFVLPEYLGRVKDSWSGKGQSLIIHIQDAHCNYACQHKISEIIEYLNREYGMDTINLEGGAKGYDLSIFTDIADKALREKAADYFVKAGVVNGAEYFAINNPDKVTLWGIEDTGLYIDNLLVYRRSLAHKEEVDEILSSLGRTLSTIKAGIYSKELLDFDMKYGAYKANNMDLKEYLSYLIMTAGRLRHSEAQSAEESKDKILRPAFGGTQDDKRGRAIEVSHYPNISLLAKTLGEEGDIDFKRANSEKDELIDNLQKRQSKAYLEELVRRTVEFKQELISQKDFYDYLADRAKQFGIDMSDYPELCRYIAYICAYDAVDKVKVMDEIEGLEDAVRQSLFRGDAERELALLSKNFTILKNFFNLSLTRDDYRYYLDNKESLNVSNFMSRMKGLVPDSNLTKVGPVPEPRNYRQGTVPTSMDSTVSGQSLLVTETAPLDRYCDELAKFYKYSFKRDDAFVKNMRLTDMPVILREAGGRPKDPCTEKRFFGLRPQNDGANDQRPTTNDRPRVSILITGGFHTKNLTELFKKHGISYISIMPNFKNYDGYECPYFKVLSGEKNVQIVDTLPGILANSMATPSQLCEDMVKAMNAFPSKSYKIGMPAVEKPERRLISEKTNAVDFMKEKIETLEKQKGKVEWSPIGSHGADFRYLPISREINTLDKVLEKILQNGLLSKNELYRKGYEVDKLKNMSDYPDEVSLSIIPEDLGDYKERIEGFISICKESTWGSDLIVIATTFHINRSDWLPHEEGDMEGHLSSIPPEAIAGFIIDKGKLDRYDKYIWKRLAKFMDDHPDLAKPFFDKRDNSVIYMPTKVSPSSPSIIAASEKYQDITPPRGGRWPWLTKLLIKTGLPSFWVNVFQVGIEQILWAAASLTVIIPALSNYAVGATIIATVVFIALHYCGRDPKHLPNALDIIIVCEMNILFILLTPYLKGLSIPLAYIAHLIWNIPTEQAASKKEIKTTQDKDKEMLDAIRSLSVQVSEADNPYGEGGYVLKLSEIAKKQKQAKNILQHINKISPEFLLECLRKSGALEVKGIIDLISISFYQKGNQKDVFKIKVRTNKGTAIFTMAFKSSAKSEDNFYEEGELEAQRKLQATGLVPFIGGVIYVEKLKDGSYGRVTREEPAESYETDTVAIEEFIEGPTVYQILESDKGSKKHKIEGFKISDIEVFKRAFPALIKIFVVLNEGKTSDFMAPHDIHHSNVVIDRNDLGHRAVVVDLGKQVKYENICQHLVHAINYYVGKNGEGLETLYDKGMPDGIAGQKWDEILRIVTHEMKRHLKWLKDNKRHPLDEGLLPYHGTLIMSNTDCLKIIKKIERFLKSKSSVKRAEETAALKVPGTLGLDEDSGIDWNYVNSLLKDSTPVSNDDEVVSTALSIIEGLGERAPPGLSKDSFEIRRVKHPGLFIPKKEGASSITEMIPALGIPEEGNKKVIIYVTEDFYDKILSKGTVPTSVDSTVSGQSLLAELIDHEYSEHMLFKDGRWSLVDSRWKNGKPLTAHQFAAQRARYFARPGKLSHYHEWILEQIEDAEFLIELEKEDRSWVTGAQIRYEEIFRDRMREKIEILQGSAADMTIEETESPAAPSPAYDEALTAKGSIVSGEKVELSIEQRLREIGLSEDAIEKILKDIGKLEGEEAKEANEILKYMISVYNTAKKVIDSYPCVVGEERNVIIPLSDKFMTVIPVEGEAKLSQIWTILRHKLEDRRFNTRHWIYNGEPDDLERVKREIEKKTGMAATEKNTIAFVEESDAARAKEIYGITVFPIKAPEEGRGYLSLGGFISLGLGILAITSVGDGRAMDYGLHVAGLIDALNNDKESSMAGACRNNYGLFIENLKNMRIVVKLPAVKKIDMDNDMSCHIIMEKALATAL